MLGTTVPQPDRRRYICYLSVWHQVVEKLCTQGLASQTIPSTIGKIIAGLTRVGSHGTATISPSWRRCRKWLRSAWFSLKKTGMMNSGEGDESTISSLHPTTLENANVKKVISALSYTDWHENVIGAKMKAYFKFEVCITSAGVVMFSNYFAT